MIHGTIVLYEKEVQGGETSMGFGPDCNLLPVTVDRKSSIIFYMFVNENLIKIGRKIKNRHLKILKDCPDLVSKIKTKKYTKQILLPQSIIIMNIAERHQLQKKNK